MAWQQEGLKPPPEVLAATEQYRAEMDVLAGFLAECCEAGDGFQIAKGKLYERYSQWCKSNGEYAMTKIAFGTRLKERGLQDSHTKRGRFWEGLMLVEGDGDKA